LEVALMSGRQIVFGGAPEELTARGGEHDVVGTPPEQGCSAVLSAARS